MKFYVKRILCLIVIIYCGTTVWFMYITWLHSLESKNNKPSLNTESYSFNSGKNKHVYIWGKAAISEYVWQHVLEGDLVQKSGYLLWTGNIKLGKLSLFYETGAYLLPHTADKSVEHLMLIINGREEKKVLVGKKWLDTVTNQQLFPMLKNLGVILLGNERCENEWIMTYLRQYKKLFRFLFIIYDIRPDHNLPLHQWPLGVATYRHFPLIKKSEVDVTSNRNYVCNFLGTIYKKFSRETLIKILSSIKHNCFIKARYTWSPSESKESQSLYHSVLKDSDLTLCPVGINSESYRIYEAFSYGSTPVLEDITTPGDCDSSKQSPYKLLKKLNAPVIYVKDWNELPDLLLKESQMSMKEKISRRENVLNWYELFRYKLRNMLLDEIGRKFHSYEL